MRDSGFATPAALILCLTVALICTAMVARSLMALKLSQAEFERANQMLGLDGAQLMAAVVVVRNGEAGPFRWTLTTNLGETELLAEAEADKVGLAAAAMLGDDVFAVLGVTDIAALRNRLQAAATSPHPDVAAMDSATLWRSCAPSIISPYGKLDHIVYPPRQSPDAVADQPAWRIGEAWRVRATTSAGWRDDRIVRFTGDPQHPAAVVWRQFSKATRGGEECDGLFTTMAAG